MRQEEFQRIERARWTVSNRNKIFSQEAGPVSSEYGVKARGCRHRARNNGRARPMWVNWRRQEEVRAVACERPEERRGHDRTCCRGKRDGHYWYAFDENGHGGREEDPQDGRGVELRSGVSVFKLQDS
jgi:hypothetical protein